MLRTVTTRLAKSIIKPAKQLNLNCSVRQMTYVPMPIFIHRTPRAPKPPVKDEEDYNQSFDFRLNPLFQCNPLAVNTYVNNNPQIPQDVRLIINSMAPLPLSFPAGTNCIYKLALDPANKEARAKHNIDRAIKAGEHVNIHYWMDKIIYATDHEFGQVNKLVFNRDQLIKKLDEDKSRATTLSIISGLVVAYLDYRYFVSSGPHTYGPYGAFSQFGYLVNKVLYDSLHSQYWTWLFPVVFALESKSLGSQRAELNEIYDTYVKEDYITKYRLKLDMLAKLKTVFA